MKRSERWWAESGERRKNRFRIGCLPKKTSLEASTKRASLARDPKPVKLLLLPNTDETQNLTRRLFLIIWEKKSKKKTYLMLHSIVWVRTRSFLNEEFIAIERPDMCFICQNGLTTQTYRFDELWCRVMLEWIHLLARGRSRNWIHLPWNLYKLYVLYKCTSICQSCPVIIRRTISLTLLSHLSQATKCYCTKIYSFLISVATAILLLMECIIQGV